MSVPAPDSPPPAAASARLPIDDLLDEAQAALAGPNPSPGLPAARRAWADCPTDDGPRRRRAGLLLSHLLYRTGALGEMVDVVLQILPLLRASGPTTELIDTLRMAALGGCDTNRFDVALSSAQEAHRLAMEIGDLGRISLSVNALACFFERSGDPWQAERLLHEALALARQHPDPHPTFVALNNLAAALIGKFYMLRDASPLEEARQPLQAALPFATEAVAKADARGEVFYRVFTLGNLGEVLVNLGYAEPARRALDEAMALARQHGFAANVWRIACSLGELRLLEGHLQTAWDDLHAGLASVQGGEQHIIRMRLHHALWRCANALGRTDDALHHLQQYVRLERARSMLQLRAQSDLFVTRMEAEYVRQEARRLDARATALEADVRRDPLTGLGNRREVELRWPELLGDVKRRRAPLSVAMLDLDHFKQVNDRHGHAVGDRVLVVLAGLLRSHTRVGDLVARMGGEEFLLVLPDAGPERAADVCERLRDQVAAHDWDRIAPGLLVTLSIGVTSTPPYEADTLSLRADAALYRAKSAGRNSVVQG
jgi:diguanylate cyclase (GGDEF)-like protein